MAEQTPPEPFIGVKEAVSYFGVKPRTIYAWRKTLGLPAHRFCKGRRGGLMLFKMSEIQLWERQFKTGLKRKQPSP